ncbi:MAG TPA: aminotransferase class I/II-fold pyridoxal phosphate-dependent enzyme [Pyrinomonadaceae bacterium]|nr:aminotransferase class I/II-fold pyridoxal phosphate-dependent enzyme [Pyrinomonadaceae bacterium]
MNETPEKGIDDAHGAHRGDDGSSTRASSLDITDEALKDLAARAVELVSGYFGSVREIPVLTQTPAGELAAQFDAPLPSAAPDSLDELFADCRRIFEGSRHSSHPRFFGYVASPATPVGAFADLIASALNQNVPAWRSAPAATEVEHTVIRWLAALAGYTTAEGASGLLTSGGSMANLNALYVAHRTKTRAKRRDGDVAANATRAVDDATATSGGGDVSQKGLWQAARPATIYVSDQAHMSIAKAADILGLGREQVRVVETDENFRMDVRRLRERIENDLRDGFQPCCIVASAGTVNTGAVDPLAEIARIARTHDLWFHIDGAYGALAYMDASKRALFAGLAEADSVSLDPHKWLYTPVDCGCLLFRDSSAVRAAWAGSEADYIKIFEETERESFAFFDYGSELSRRFRALKIWMLLRYYGAERIASAIAEDNALAAYFAARVEAATDFELLAPVELSICCFRYAPPEARRRLAQAASAEERARVDAGLNELNERIMRAVQRGGRAYVSNALLGGRFALRACIVNFRTTRRDIRATLEIIREAAGHVKEEA